MPKKKIHLILCVLLALSLLLCACADDPENSEQTTEPTTHTVTFDSQGGTYIPPVTVPHAAPVPEPPTPVRENSVFLGWYNGNVPWFFSKTVREDVTLVARWEDSSFDFEYEIVNDCAIIKGLTASPKKSEIIVPSTIKGFPVTGIAEGAFKDGFSDTVTRISLPASITSIGADAFKNCINLNIFLSTAAITYVGESAFENCNLLSGIIFGEGLTELPMSAFKGCTGLVSVFLPSTVTLIDESVFEGCRSLAAILIPASVEEIGHSAFRDCDSLSTILFGGNRVQFDSLLTCVNSQKNEAFFDASEEVCLYSETQPTTEGSFWHYDDTHSPKVW